MFQPRLTYTVLSGWANWEDTIGNFNLVPPGQTQDGINAGTSDFIGVYASVAAPNGCEEGTAPGVGLDEPSIVRWVLNNGALDVREHARAAVGGLHGDVFVVTIGRNWHKPCPYSNGMPVAPLITGTGNTGLDHNVFHGVVTRLYLLARGHDTLAIECSDVHGGKNLRLDDPVVKSLRFG